jgi:hypothetical protein
MNDPREVRWAARLVLCLLLSAEMAPSAQQNRTLRGAVVDGERKPLTGAIVQLKNLRTLRIRSYVTGRDGSFYFARLHSDIDYELRARLGEVWSEPKSISRFDSALQIQVTLEIERPR